MNAIKKVFVRAKHWQVFLLLFGLFVAGNAVGVGAMIRNPADVFAAMLPIFALTEALALCFALWLWCLGSFLNSRLDVSRRRGLAFFHFAVIYPLLYMLVFMAVFQNMGTNPGLLLLIHPLHCFAMACLLYDFYFVSKSLALVENTRTVSLSNYIGYFFCFWIFPVGVWITQPRINRLYSSAAPLLTSTDSPA